jgi:hypothetical protein
LFVAPADHFALVAVNERCHSFSHCFFLVAGVVKEVAVVLPMVKVVAAAAAQLLGVVAV